MKTVFGALQSGVSGAHRENMRDFYYEKILSFSGSFVQWAPNAFGRWKQYHRLTPRCNFAARAGHGKAKRLWIKCFHLNHLLSASRVIGAPPPSPLPPSDAQTPTAPSNSRRCEATAVENTYEFNVSSFGQLWGARTHAFRDLRKTYSCFSSWFGCSRRPQHT